MYDTINVFLLAEIFPGGHGNRPCAQPDRPHGQQPSSYCLQTGGLGDDMENEVHSLARSFQSEPCGSGIYA